MVTVVCITSLSYIVFIPPREEATSEADLYTIVDVSKKTP